MKPALEKAVLFVDMLGFSALVEEHPHALVNEGDSPQTGTKSNPSESLDKLRDFHRAIEASIGPLVDYTPPVTALVFSDSAFLVFEAVPSAAFCAAELIRNLLSRHVPARMGLAAGTCHMERFTSDVASSFRVARAIFLGTAIVRSHRAEKTGGKGCRIFVHPSYVEFAGGDTAYPRLLPLAHPQEGATFEVSYALHDRWRTLFVTSREEQSEDDKMLVEDVRAMMTASPTDGVAIHYQETLLALSRMFEAEGRISPV